MNRYNKVDMCKIIAKGLRARGFRIHWLSFYGFPQIELKAFCDFLFSLWGTQRVPMLKCQRVHLWRSEVPKLAVADNENGKIQDSESLILEIWLSVFILLAACDCVSKLTGVWATGSLKEIRYSGPCCHVENMVVIPKGVAVACVMFLGYALGLVIVLPLLLIQLGVVCWNFFSIKCDYHLSRHIGVHWNECKSS